MQKTPDQNRKTPKYSVHIYDLNVLNIKLPDNLELKNQKGKLFASALVQTIQDYCQFEDIDFDLHQKNNYPIIISSTHNFHFIFLEYALCYYDPIKITRFLDYQYDNFKGNYYSKNKEQFVGLIESIVYPWIKNHHPCKSEKYLKAIMAWIDMMKPIDLFKAYPKDFFVKIENEKFKKKVHNIFSNYFDPKDSNRLNDLLSGKPIHGKLIFYGASNQLFDAFKRLVGKNIVNSNAKSTERWLAHFFLYQSVGHKPTKITETAAHQIISNHSLICKNPISQFADWLP